MVLSINKKSAPRMEGAFLYEKLELQTLHLVALSAIVLNREGVFAFVVAGSA